MFVLEKNGLKVELAEDASLLRISDAATGMALESEHAFRMMYGMFYRYDIPEHSRIRVSVEGNAMTVRFDHFSFWARFPEHYYVKPENGPALEFVFRIVLENGTVRFITETPEGMDDEPCEVTFPAAFFRWRSDEENDLVLSKGYGSLYRFPFSGVCSFAWHCISGILPLPLYGLFGKKGGFGVYLATPCDQSSFLNVNRTVKGEAFSETRWEFERGDNEYGREVRLKFFGKGADYVNLAKWYRSIVRDEGRFVSLKEKIAANPEVGQLAGAVIWKHNVYTQKIPPPEVHKDYSLYIMRPEDPVVEGKPANWTAYEVFDTARANGFDRVCIYNTGWNRYGFDSGYPTRFPPNPERGTEQEIREAAAYGKSLSPGFFYGVHDNYRDSYPNSPEYRDEEMFHDKNMQVVKGGIWRGGRCRLMCGIPALEYAKRDLPKIAALTGRGSIYIDVLGLVSMRSCHHPEHRLSRPEDLKYRREILREAKKHFGSVATEGTPADFCADIADLGAFYFFTAELDPVIPPPVPVPLWQLVYHDSVFGYTSEGLCGYSGKDFLAMTALYGMLPTQFDPESRRISVELRSACCAEMLSHRLLPLPAGSAGFAAETVFSDGTRVVANCSDRSIELDGISVDAHAFHIEHNLTSGRKTE